MSNGCSDATRGLRFGGVNSATAFGNRIDFVTIQTAGNATDFGDLITPVQQNIGVSDIHGGLAQ